MQIRWYHNNQGPIISTTKEQVIEIDGSYFKDLAGTGEFLPYEDWRLPANTRAEDLAKRLSIEEMAGLMLYSSHQMIPGRAGNVFSAKYGGRDYDKTVNQPWELSDLQIEFLSKDHLRHVLVVKYENIETAVEWNNNMQTLVENQPWGIPINFSSDPRHSAEESTAEYKNTAADTSKWPGGIGISATFSPVTCKMFAEIASKEYRALGITTSLAPQVDLATEPRWMRAVDTFGGQTELALAMAKAYCDGMQTTIGSDTGWGSESVISMAKHWPGGGTGEGGRDAHYWFGKYNVYPGESFLEHLKPFTEGALSLEGPTKQARAI
ncbi:MAG: glycoside hydrolase family 3 N-terminal domain-containing protein, partial [Mobilitalea sp.]